MRLAAVLVLAGCGDDRRVPPAPRPSATVSSTPAPLPAREVRFEASDGEPVTAKYTAAGTHAPAVLLLHQIRQRPEQWDCFVPVLHAAGFATLAVRSRSSVIEHERVRDALGALRWLRARPDVDRRRIAIVGASTTVLAMATGARRTVDAAVALSPPDTPDIWKLQDAGRYHPHDLLLVSDDGESETAGGISRAPCARPRSGRPVRATASTCWPRPASATRCSTGSMSASRADQPRAVATSIAASRVVTRSSCDGSSPVGASAMKP